MKKNRPNVAPLAALLGSSSAAVAVRSTFECMEIAERQLARQFRSKSSEPKGAFRTLVPSAVLQGKAIRLYEAHVRELIARMVAGVDLCLATDAECLAAFSDASVVAPPRHENARAFAVLFGRVFPEEASGGALSEFASEAWLGRDKEIIDKVRRGLAQPDRELDSLKKPWRTPVIRTTKTGTWRTRKPAQ